MKRLLKRAFIGDIKKNDIEFTWVGDQDNSTIYVTLINPAKQLHDGDTSWARWETVNNDQIGYLTFGTEIYTLNNKTKDIIDIEYLQVHDAYKETQVTMYLLQEFEDKVLKPAIAKYGNNNVSLESVVINDKLSSMLARILKKMGITWQDSGIPATKRSFLTNIQDELTTLGYTFETKDYDIIIKNQSPIALYQLTNDNNYGLIIQCDFTNEGELLLILDPNNSSSLDAKFKGNIYERTIDFWNNDKNEFITYYQDNPTTVVNVIQNYLSDYDFSFLLSPTVNASQLVRELQQKSNEGEDSVIAKRLKRR